MQENSYGKTDAGAIGYTLKGLSQHTSSGHCEFHECYDQNIEMSSRRIKVMISLNDCGIGLSLHRSCTLGARLLRSEAESIKIFP